MAVQQQALRVAERRAQPRPALRIAGPEGVWERAAERGVSRAAVANPRVRRAAPPALLDGGTKARATSARHRRNPTCRRVR